MINEEQYKKCLYDKSLETNSNIGIPKKNFIKENIESAKDFYFELNETVEKFYPNLSALNIHKLMKHHEHMDRKELYKIFMQFKTLLKVSIGLSKNLKTLKKGLEFPAFYIGVNQMRNENEDLAKKVFDSLNSTNKTNSNLDWDDFMKGILAFQDPERSAKINLFFKVKIIIFINIDNRC